MICFIDLHDRWKEKVVPVIKKETPGLGKIEMSCYII